MRNKIVIGVLASLMALSCARGGVPAGWWAAGEDEYEFGVDKTVVRDGKPSAYIASITNTPKQFTSMSQMLSAEKYAGKRVKLSGYLKTKNVKKWAGFWLRVDGKDVDNMNEKGGFAFATMQDNGALSGNTDWTGAKLVLDVPLEAKEIVFGVILDGVGKVWINNVKFEVVSKDEPLTNYSDMKTEPVNLDFSK